MPQLKSILRTAVSLRAIPMLIGYAVIPAAREVIDKDVVRWQECKVRPERGLPALLLLLTDTTHEFRNLYNFRLAKTGVLGVVISRSQAMVFKPELSLFVRSDSIGPGLYIQHGFATAIAAESIGANCWVNQQVTIGKNSFGRAPRIEDDVVIATGAIVIGGITIGKAAHIGAGAVVTKDVPAGMVAVGVPATYHQPGANSRAHGPGGRDAELGEIAAAGVPGLDTVSLDLTAPGQPAASE
jgi:serine O-acetyltransferase